MIRKIDIEKYQRETYENDIKALENRIDQALAKCSLPVRVSVNGLAEIVLKTVAEKYRTDGGYKVEIERSRDQRDPGTDIVLS